VIHAPLTFRPAHHALLSRIVHGAGQSRFSFPGFRGGDLPIGFLRLAKAGGESL
jgi:hypothetical protein